MPIVTFITDYGTRDHYVGAMKGVLLRLAPTANLVDITHDIEPHNVTQAAFVLRHTLPWYPEGTIHVAVVDPGVGSDRDILLGQYLGQYVIAPNNGLLTFVHREIQADAVHVLENRRYFLSTISPTFHGRDIMAPVAAHLALGVDPSVFGRIADRVEMLPVQSRAQTVGASLRGEILYVDRFGTMVTNIHGEQLDAFGSDDRAATVWVGADCIGPVRESFSDVAPGEPVALIGGAGLLEIAVNQGRAVEQFAKGNEIRVEARPSVP